MFVLDFQRSGSRVRAVAPARLLVSRNVNVPTAGDTLSSLYVMKALDVLCLEVCSLHSGVWHPQTLFSCAQCCS